MMKTLYTLAIRVFAVFTLLAGFFLLSHSASAQLVPFGASYYQNQYLFNPAMAGYQQGLAVQAGYRQQWSAMPGSLKAQYVTGDYRFSDKVGLGITVTNQEAGLINESKFAATYAYHLVLNDARKRTLHFGLSAGVQREHLDEGAVKGDPDDPLVSSFNNRGVYVDGDFGVVFTEDKLTAQFALPNARMFFEDLSADYANRPTFFASLSYKLITGGVTPVGIEPKVCYRGVTNYKNLFDVGANFTFQEGAVHALVVYHSSKNATLGAGMNIASRFRFTALYLTGTPSVGSYSKGNFELALRVLLKEKK